MRFLYSAKYRREVVIEKPLRGLYKIVKPKRNTNTKMHSF